MARFSRFTNFNLTCDTCITIRKKTLVKEVDIVKIYLWQPIWMSPEMNNKEMSRYSTFLLKWPLVYLKKVISTLYPMAGIM